ncbi:N-acetyltransferase [Chryseobacterium manosquense]|uniref:N-acetyltransferase n=2 Tax=Chryseobacterium group TaxID=2782232 RepID=A0A246BBM0_9FLAO|nr:MULTISPECIES: GNAT family N-acetyltransferase [Chryseobacterium group]AZB21923.1 N-acetyltransferase [Kaistella haifensis]MCB4234761.1 N-acetyltransferase [Kaistella anthropi]MDN5578826.1 N-acetyltransferase [Chryseobacterium sp.]OWK99056.1 N-acetyltransferase [Kaistella haifensis DSM 19056]QNS41488.1 N-acetyltransferase [Chryseobacterium manosquense]
MTEIKHQNNEKNGVFEIYEDGVKAGEMTYTWAGTDKFIIDHTGVDEAFNGKGYAKQLIYAGVEYAREKGIKIIPLCSFAKKTIEKTLQFQDVLS